MTPGRPDLGSVFKAEVKPALSVQLPRSGREVDIQLFLRREKRHSDPVPRSASCWAPNKPAIDHQGTPMFSEFVLVRLLEEAGWEARWVKNWAGGREFCVDVDRPRDLPPTAARQFIRIHERAAALRGAGSWDVLAWRGDEFLFIESKQHRSSDRLNDNQRAWLEAALEVGIAAESFAIVEYDASGPSVAPDAGLIRRFDADMEAIHVGARAIGYNATRYLMMLREHGGLETARRLLRGTEISYAFAELWMLGRVDLTVEALVIRPEYAVLFSPAEIATARERLGK